MKLNIKYFLFCLGGLFLASCGNDFDVDEFYDLQELPGYVAFDADGNSITLDTVATAEDAGMVALTIECPTGTLSDVTVTYDISGTAVMGVDYNIASGTAGSIVIQPDEFDFQNRDNVDLEIELLTDDVADGTKTITFTLTGATNAEGSLAVGRGGTDLLKSADVKIADID